MPLFSSLFSNINQADAGTSTQNVNFNTNINSNCVLLNPVPVAFGTYDPVVTNASTPLTTTGSFDIKCNAKSVAVLSINNGQNASHASGTTRAMAGPNSNYLNYDLYTTK